MKIMYTIKLHIAGNQVDVLGPLTKVIQVCDLRVTLTLFLYIKVF